MVNYALALIGQLPILIERANIYLCIEARILDSIFALLVALDGQFYRRFSQLVRVKCAVACHLERVAHYIDLIIVNILLAWQTHRHNVLTVLDRFLFNSI
jgi:hypothetical protein